MFRLLLLSKSAEDTILCFTEPYCEVHHAYALVISVSLPVFSVSIHLNLCGAVFCAAFTSRLTLVDSFPIICLTVGHTLCLPASTDESGVLWKPLLKITSIFAVDFENQWTCDIPAYQHSPF